MTPAPVKMTCHAKTQREDAHRRRAAGKTARITPGPDRAGALRRK